MFPEIQDYVPGEPRLCSREVKQLSDCVDAELRKIPYNGSISEPDITFLEKHVTLVDTLFEFDFLPFQR